MNKFIASAALTLAVGVAQPASAGSVVFESDETTSWASLWESLPGYGSYTFEFIASAPVSYTLVAEYEYHWDIFVAPAPKPHNESIEGNNDLTGQTWSATASAFTHVFHVGEMSRSFFRAGDEYEGWGISPGTKMYREVSYENPYFEFWAELPNGDDFSYSMKVSRFASVPEPSTWAMMIMGFGAVGSMVRTSRRRRISMSA